MIIALLAAGVLLAQAEPAAAPPPAAPPASEAPAAGKVVSPLTVTGGKAKPAPETQVVCHKESVIGSLFPKEVCATRREFAERRQNDQQQVRDWVAIKPLKVN